MAETTATAKEAITKAVIPAAGLGTRFLPVTKATPKEMLPVVDTPAIQYVVEEAVSAGMHDVLMITGRGKGSIENYFDRNQEPRGSARGQGRRGRAPADPRLQRARGHDYVRQGAPEGLGDAVLCAAEHVGDVPSLCCRAMT